MIAFLLDVLGGWLAARYLKNLAACMAASVVLGVLAAAAGAFLISLVGDDIFSDREVAVRFISGIIWHPVVAVVAAFVFRRRFKRSEQQRNAAPDSNP